MSDEVDRFIDSIAGLRSGTRQDLTSARGTRGGFDFGIPSATWSPQIEVIQKPNAVVLRADLPGLKADDVNVSVEDGMLTISGERKQEEREEREGGYIRSERSYGTFYRAFTLPDSADDEKVSASFKDGVLEVTIPITERERGRRIKVQS